MVCTMLGRHRAALARSNVTRIILGLVVTLWATAGLMADETRLVDVYAVERDNGGYHLFATNHHIVPVYVQVDLPNLINLTPDRDLPVAFGLEPGDREVPILSLTPVRRSGRIGYSVQYSFAQGNPDTAVHDPEAVYLLPFGHGTKHRLSQGFQGRFSHFGENEYAVDFEMDVGTPVYASRAGTVAEVKEDSRIGGPSASYGDDANYILIHHSDGSFGNYAHLQYDGAIVEPGVAVLAGQQIGYSGNTGRSSGPHLHFDVRLPTYEGRMESVPFRLVGRDGVAAEPLEGIFYYAYHPGGPPFDEDLGTSVSIEQYENYRVPFNGSEAIDTRIEQVDLTFLLFVQNGFSEDVEVEIELQLSGLASDAGGTVRVNAPARSEVLATILRPLPGATTIRYAYTIRYFR